MATKKKSRSRRRSFSSRIRRRAHGLKIPLAVALGFTPLVAEGINNVRAAGWSDGLRDTMSALIPYDFAIRKVTTSRLGHGLYPILAGFAVHKIVGGMLGVNRVLGRMGIPFVRI
jgi:hypothetical protein